MCNITDLKPPAHQAAFYFAEVTVNTYGQKNNNIFSVRLSTEQREKLATMAKASGSKAGEVLRRLIDDAPIQTDVPSSHACA